MKNGMFDRPARVSHWLAVLREPGWKFFIALPFTLFAVLAPIRDEFLPTEMAEKWKLPSIIKNHFPTLLVAIPWYVWALITAFVLIWLMFVGIKNSSTTKSADDVTIRAHESWFVGNTISEAHRRIDEPLKKSPLIFSRATPEPGAVEFIELFGQGPNPTTLPGNVFKIDHDFVLEARARDAQTVLLTLRYEPTEPFATIKEAMTS